MSLKKERILIVGGSSFIGVNLIRFFKEKSVDGHELYAIGFSNKVNFIDDAHVFNVDISDSEQVNNVIRKVRPDVVYNLSALTRESWDLSKINEVYKVNMIGMMNLLCSLKKNEVRLKTFIQVSTAEEYGDVSLGKVIDEESPLNPTSFYSASKASASMFCELFSRMFETPITIVKISLVYGPGQKDSFFIPNAINKILKGEKLEMTMGEQRRDFVYIDDCSEALFLMKDQVKTFEVVNLVSGESITLKEVIQKISSKISSDSEIIFGALPYRKNEIFQGSYSNERIRKRIEWEPKTNFEEGITKTIAYCKGEEFDYICE